MTRGTWDEYFMGIAEAVAQRSKDPTTKVGCIIVTDDRVISSTGYNGIPAGVSDSTHRMQRPAKYLWTSHAEENAVALSARVGARLKGGAAYVTHAPCARCARMLIQAGIKEVFVGTGTTSMPQEEFDVAEVMFSEAGVAVYQQTVFVQEIIQQ